MAQSQKMQLPPANSYTLTPRHSSLGKLSTLIKFRSLEFFKGKDVAEDIAQIRLQHYEEKRKGKIRLLSDTIKLGMLDSLKETFKSPDRLSKTEAKVRKAEMHNTGP
jgi:hypothetical protein